MISKHRFHRSHLFVVLVASLAFFALAASDPQCAKVSDRVTAPDASLDQQGKGGVADCVQSCVSFAKTARADEQDLHKANVAACGDDAQCLAQEEARHEAAMEQIAMDERDCKAPCHNQGTGTGGQ